MTKALDIQVGGNHYKDLVIQPVEYIHANKIGYFEGNVIKYVSRWRAKNGIADLEKAKHYIDLLIEQENMNASKNRSGQHQSSGEANHNDGVGIPSINSRRINDAPRLQPKWPVISGCPSEEELGSIPSIADVIRKECSRNEQQGKPFPIPNYFMQGTMGGCSVRGSSVFFDHGQDRAAQAVGQSSP